MKSLEEAAAYYRLGLTLGTHSVVDVVEWADGQIAMSESPPIDLLELSLMGNSHPLDVLGMLGQLDGNNGALDVFSIVLADAYEILVEERSFGPMLARGLRGLYEDCSYEVPEAFKPICWFDEYYALARLGLIGTEEEVYEELLEFTATFRESHCVGKVADRQSE